MSTPSKESVVTAGSGATEGASREAIARNHAKEFLVIPLIMQEEDKLAEIIQSAIDEATKEVVAYWQGVATQERYNGFRAAIDAAHNASPNP